MNKAPAQDMARLPRLSSGSSAWYLPLSDHAALELARVLVMAVPQARESRLAELMAVDPPFALWTACRAGRESTVAPRCVLDLARWVAPQLLAVLQWAPDDGAGVRAARDLRARWRELSADSIAVAHLAADQAPGDVQAAEAFLLGLFHNAAEWLRGCGPRISFAKADAGCLPGWLFTVLRERAKAPRREVLPLVAQAASAWRAAGRRGRRVGQVDLADVAIVRRRWQVGNLGDETARQFLRLLTDRLRRLEELDQRFAETLETEKLAALGELAYGASHEINNPLANISTRAQAMLAAESDLEKRRMLATISAQAFRAHEMIADLMFFARPPTLDCHRVDLVALVDDVITELRDDAVAQGTRLARGSGVGELMATVDATQLAMAIRAVCTNALEALMAEGEVEVSVTDGSRADPESPCWARIAVRDTGPGIPPAVRRHLFDPFYSGREAGRGLGVGLAKCWRVVTLHGGRVEVVAHEPRGTTFILELPITADRQAEVPSA